MTLEDIGYNDAELLRDAIDHATAVAEEIPESLGGEDHAYLAKWLNELYGRRLSAARANRNRAKAIVVRSTGNRFSDNT